MKRARIYVRKSTNKQSEETIETQIEKCRQWAQENNCVITEIYDDSGKSGRAYNVKNRRGFNQIKADAAAGLMDYALIYTIDRFARSVADYFIQERALEDEGVKLIVVGMPFLQEADIITKSVHVAMAEQFSENLSKDVYAKMRTFAKKKAYLGGPAPIGFKIVTDENGEKTLDVDPEKSEMIRLVFHLYLQGFGYVSIARIVAEKGYTNQNGNPYHPNVIRQLLRNPKYNGYYVFGRRSYINGKQIMNDLNDTEKVIMFPDVYEKIIDDETYNAVQKRLKEISELPRNKRRKESRFYCLTGRIRCGSCGSSMTGYSCRNQKGVEYTYYTCTARTRKGFKCSSKAVRADHLESYIAEQIAEKLFTPKLVKELAAEVVKTLSGDVAEFRERERTLEYTISDIKSQIKNAMRDKYSNRIDQDMLDDLLADYNRELYEAETRLASVKQKINAQDKASEIKAYIQELQSNLKTASDEVKGVFIQQAVNQVIVNEDSIEIYLYASEPPAVPPDGSALCLYNISNGVPLFSLHRYRVYILESLSIIGLTVVGIKKFNAKEV